MKRLKKSPPPRIEFPEEDREWMELQERVISVLGKPIEDLTFGDRSALRNVLNESEMDAVNRYSRLKRMETCKAFEGVVGSCPWEQQRCQQTLEALVDFQDFIRAVAVRISWILARNEQKDYEDVFQKIETELFTFIRNFPNLESLPEKGKSWHIANRILSNIGRIPPTGEKAFDMLERFYDLLEAREAELERQKKQESQPPPTPVVEKAPRQLATYEVTFSISHFNFEVTFLVRAEDENDAGDWACDFFHDELREERIRKVTDRRKIAPTYRDAYLWRIGSKGKWKYFRRTPAD